jgi:flagellar hook-length control protein FliK
MEAAPETARPQAPAPAPARPSAEAQARAADILQQVKVGLVPELGQATIRLAPRELGRISISLTLEQGRARATLRAERPETLEALTRHVPELRAALEQRGIEPGDIRLELLDRHATDGRARDPEHEHPRHDGRRDRTRTPADELGIARAALARTLSDEAVDLYA